MFINSIRTPFTSACLQFVTKRFAGHSKWQNIRHTKAAKDVDKSLMIIRLGHRIKLAVLETGISNPALNSRLAQAVEVAKRKNMPSTTIQSYINQGIKGNSDLKEVIYEFRGPRGSFFIIQTFTENPKRTRDTIISIAKKNNLTMETNLKQHFSHRGIITAAGKNIKGDHVDHAIESGAEDVENVDKKLNFFCHPNQVKVVADKLQELGYEIEEADEFYIPATTISLDDEILEFLSKALDKIYSLPEVSKIYDNIA